MPEMPITVGAWRRWMTETCTALRTGDTSQEERDRMRDNALEFLRQMGLDTSNISPADVVVVGGARRPGMIRFNVRVPGILRYLLVLSLDYSTGTNYMQVYSEDLDNTGLYSDRYPLSGELTHVELLDQRRLTRLRDQVSEHLVLARRTMGTRRPIAIRPSVDQVFIQDMAGG